MLSHACRWSGCEYPAPFGDHCYFHDKVARGIFNERLKIGTYDNRGIYVSRTSGEQRTGALASAVIDDEQREMADLLEAIGVEPELVKGAITRSSSPSMLRRTGSGQVEGRSGGSKTSEVRADQPPISRRSDTGHASLSR